MTSYGKTETEKLKQNVESQLDRLMEQLADLESCKDDLDPSEYVETKEETMEQLKELNKSLSKLVNGDISLVSSLGSIQLATQAAISEAFKTPEVIRLFGRREPKQLRDRLSGIEEQLKLNKIGPEAGDRQKLAGGDLIFGGVYVPPNLNIEKYIAHCTTAEEIGQFFRDAKLLVYGDFNLPNTVWGNNKLGLTIQGVTNSLLTIGISERGEILTALRQLNEQLTREELQFLEKHNSVVGHFKNIEFLEVKDEN